MRIFRLLNEKYCDIIDFYQSLDKKNAVLKSCEIRCYSEEFSASKFGEFLSEILPEPSRPISSAFSLRVGAKFFSAIWDVVNPVQVEDEQAILRWHHLFSAAIYRLCLHDCDFEIILHAFDKSDVLMETPYFLHPLPAFHNTWGARQATITAKVDSFEGILLRDVPRHMRRIWIDNMIEGIRTREPLPFSISEAKDHLEVTWHFQEDAASNEMLSSVFWNPGQDCSNDFGPYYDLYEKEEFLYEIDQLQLLKAGDLDD
ncbi:hypothetical protein [Paenibacillus sp. V4I7]|uniref:hypothetical protein n=1 Tax=Paenibacillus sp. V4I7 TaxID=3042307 RepID=UPI002786177F|nr:hypothetical protein [Paenibacillus sp. V4I7]MDQ0902769.1 hypothetical protein [Paenibacillus sp. V4I7]